MSVAYEEGGNNGGCVPVVGTVCLEYLYLCSIDIITSFRKCRQCACLAAIILSTPIIELRDIQADIDGTIHIESIDSSASIAISRQEINSPALSKAAEF